MKTERATPTPIWLIGVCLCALAYAGQALPAEMSEVVAAVPRDFLSQKRGGEAGQTQSFAIDLMNEVAKRAQVRVTYRVFDTMHEVLAALERGDADLVPNLGVTERREGRMLFTRPVETTRISLFVRESTSGIDGLTNLFGRTLGVVNGNVAEEILDQRETDVSRITYKHFPDALFGLLAGEVDALAYPETAAWRIIQGTRLTDRIKVVGASLMEAKYAIAVRRDLPHLLERLDLAVAEVLRSPQYQEIYSRWYAAPPPFWTVKRVGWKAGVTTVVLVAGLLGWSTLRLRGLNRRLDESVRQQSAILDSIPDIAWLKDCAGRFIVVNESFGRACGRSPKELVGKTDLDLWPGGLARGYRTDDREVMDTEERKRVEEQLVDSDGSETWIETIKTPVLNDKGEVIGTTGIARNITSRKRAEATLRESEHSFRDLADSASDWFWEMGPDLRFTWVSDQLEVITGIPSASLIGRSHEDLGKPLLQEGKGVQRLEDLRARHSFKDVQYQLGAAGRKDIYYVSVSGVPVFEENGEFRGYRGTGRDITAQVRAQNEAAQARQRLSDAIESISEGFALWDDNDRLVLCNSKNHEFYSAIADILRPGISFEEVIREAMKRGACHLGGVEPQRWIQERLHQHRNPSGAWEQCLADGRWLLVTERRTPEGGIVGVRTDITAIKKAEEASCRSKEFLDHVLDAIDHDVFVKDERHRWVILNKAACELIGGSREELIGRSDDDFFSAEQTALNWKTDDEALESGNTIEYEWKAKKNGQCRTFLTKKSAFSDSSSEKQYIAGVAIDITERKQAEEALFHEKERAQVTLHCIGDGVITTDPSCGVEYLNPVAEALTGWTTEEAQGNPLAVIFNILEEQSRTPVPNPVACCLKEGQIVDLANHTVLISRYGQEHAIEDSASPIRGRDGEVLGAVLVFHDVTETRRMARQLQHDAAHDELTGLVNRREFEKRLERALVSAKRDGFHHALCYFDLDQFKLVNDAAGHTAGDALLKQVPELVSGKFRERDTLARLGGDEFALLLEHCALHEAIRIAEIVVATFREWRFVWNGRTFQVGVSIGVVAITSEAETAEQLLAQADVACYAAKERGGNRAHVY